MARANTLYAEFQGHALAVLKPQAQVFRTLHSSQAGKLFISAASRNASDIQKSLLNFA